MGDLSESKLSEKQSCDLDQDHVMFTQVFLNVLNKPVDIQQPDIIHCFDPVFEKKIV